ncbi:PREDICTED: LOB domain-containing protein 36-like [Tarenaya hassleriana]|uniref:LOB domain-containing protein 36-like n=1 Tax=Tarenaya hassleriana TaxID=28532 RepID=UPI00053C50D5|nr:PREDICTED: LOB domain-containing protein 36-like [Tarenaya hassleriana]XP_010547505.1 PREDICTED: LOB domain-containing protein 36-like [Tarenaya hassleriana]
MSSSSSPCAACKFLRRKCTQECVFAPYFPPDQPQKFAYVHKVFGASNVSKLLNHLSPNQREDAVNSLFYEAEARLRDPVYGCGGLISILQHRLKQLQLDLDIAKKELAACIGPQAMLPIMQPSMAMHHQLAAIGNPSSSPSVMADQHQNMVPAVMAIPTAQPHGQLHIYEAQQLAAAAAMREQHIFRTYGGGHHQNQLNQSQVENLRFESASGPVTVTGFNQTSSGATVLSPPSLALCSFDSPSDQFRQQHEALRFVPTHSAQPKTELEEGSSAIGPSC